MYLLCNIRHSILEKPKSKLEQKFRHTSSIALYYTNLLSRYKELLPKITANLVVIFLPILSIKGFQEIEAYFNYITILEKTAKESLSNHDPTESEILQQGYGMLQMARRDGFIAFVKPKQKPS